MRAQTVDRSVKSRLEDGQERNNARLIGVAGFEYLTNHSPDMCAEERSSSPRATRSERSRLALPRLRANGNACSVIVPRSPPGTKAKCCLIVWAHRAKAEQLGNCQQCRCTITCYTPTTGTIPNSNKRSRPLCQDLVQRAACRLRITLFFCGC